MKFLVNTLIYSSYGFMLFLMVFFQSAYALDRPVELIVQDWGGNRFNMAELKGQVVMVTFWASWCVPCLEEMPVIDAYYQQNRKRGFSVIALSLDRSGGKSKAQKIMQSFSYPAAFADDVEVNTLVRPSVLPFGYIINKKGMIAAIINSQEGVISRQKLYEIIGPLLESP